MSIEMAGPVAFLSESKSAVFFSKSPASGKPRGTSNIIKRLQNEKNIAFWGEDNRFPQNIEQQLAYCGVARAGLDWKARTLYGNGIVPGTITGVQDDGTEIFTPQPRSNEIVYKFLENRSMFRFLLEYFQDWTTYNNTFPEMILSEDAKSITGLVHQESCDSRFQQMNEDGDITSVFLSKLWGASSDQFAKFDPKKAMRGLQRNPESPDLIESKYIKKVDCIDMYDSLNSLQNIAKSLEGKDGLKSAILPVNYPSVNKTYYQVPAWDGARLAGWLEISAKIPSMLKALYTKAFRIRYHIEVPWSFFEEKYTPEGWAGMDEAAQTAAKKALLKDMDDGLSGDENAYKSFITFYQVNPQDKKEYGKITINEVPDTAKLDKEFITQSAADIQTLVAMQVSPTLFGAGTIGTGQQRSGGSDKREDYNIYISGLSLERNVLLEPLYLVRDYNREVGGMDEWKEDLVFRFRDTVMTTLDKGHGQESSMNPASQNPKS